MKLEFSKIPSYTVLRNYIRTYNFPNFINNENLTRLKAIDAIKDGAPSNLAIEVFLPGNTNPIGSPDDLKTKIKARFNEKVKNNTLILLEYTRIKSRAGDIYFDNVHYDYYIPDCGPSYAPGNGKTPVVQKAGGDTPEALYSLGNTMDTGPSSNNKINLFCNENYNIPGDVFSALGYAGCEMTNVNDKTQAFTIKLTHEGSTEMIDRDGFTKYTVGNKQKKGLLNKSGELKEKKKLLYFKSLGDTMIVFYWFWAARTANATKKSVALLTCDSVVALQADIFSQTPENDNAHWLLNYTEKGEKHISYVYYKGSPPDYKKLFAAEQTKIIKSYTQEIQKFELIFNGTNDFTIGSGNLRDIPGAIDLIDNIIERLTEEKAKAMSIINRNNEESYSTLKSYTLLPLIKSEKDGVYTLIRSRFKLNVADTHFIYGSIKQNVDKIITELKIKKRKYETDSTDETSKRQRTYGGRNEFLEEDLEHFLTLKKQPPEDEAVHQLNVFIQTIFNELLEKEEHYNYMTDEQKQLLHKYAEEISLYKMDDDGSLYDMLTYEFHHKPDYSREHIIELCKPIVTNVIYSSNIFIIENIVEKKREAPASAPAKTHASAKGQASAPAKAQASAPARVYPSFKPHIASPISNPLAVINGGSTKKKRKSKRTLRKKTPRIIRTHNRTKKQFIY